MRSFSRIFRYWQTISIIGNALHGGFISGEDYAGKDPRRPQGGALIDGRRYGALLLGERRRDPQTKKSVPGSSLKK